MREANEIMAAFMKGTAEIQRLRKENAELRDRVDGLQRALSAKDDVLADAKEQGEDLKKFIGEDLP